MEDTRQAKTILAASLMSSMTVGMGCFGRLEALSMSLSAVAMVSLLLGGLLLEKSIVNAFKGTLTRGEAGLTGVLFGLPLSFFFFQHEVALSAGDLAKAQGSEKVVGTVGFIILFASLANAWRRRKSQRT